MGGPHNNGREEIFDKLNGALAAFRRERDDLRRKKELATERLRLVTEEREVCATVHVQCSMHFI
jgi:hypothetical protein